MFDRGVAGVSHWVDFVDTYNVLKYGVRAVLSLVSTYSTHVALACRILVRGMEHPE